MAGSKMGEAEIVRSGKIWNIFLDVELMILADGVTLGPKKKKKIGLKYNY